MGRSSCRLQVSDRQSWSFRARCAAKKWGRSTLLGPPLRMLEEMALFPVFGAIDDHVTQPSTTGALFPVLPEEAADSGPRAAGSGDDGGSSSESSGYSSPAAADGPVDEFGRTQRSSGKRKSSSQGKGRKKHKHKDKDKDRDARRHRHKHKKHKKHKKESHGTDSAAAKEEEEEAAWRAVTAAADIQTAFTHDTTGDRQHVQLDSIYAGAVPKFNALRRRSRRNTQATDRDDALRYYQAGRALSRRIRSSTTGAADRRARRDPALLSSDTGPIGVGGDFVALSDDTATGSGPTAAESGEADKLTAETEEQRLIRLTKDFNERTRSQPGDEALWLRFAAFQEEFLVLSKRRNKGKGSAAIAAKKIAILHAGVRANPQSERLLYAYLELCAQVWEHGAALGAWRAAVAQHPSSLRLWRRYLRFSVGTFAAFSLTAATAAYTQAFKQLSERVAAAFDESRRATAAEAWRHRSRAAALERTHYGLVLDWSELLHRAGFTERSVGVLQAAVELNMFAPKHLLPAAAAAAATPVGDMGLAATRLRFYEAFWESEAPRLGDDGAEGWGTWLVKAQERLANANAQHVAAEAQARAGVADASGVDPSSLPLSGGGGGGGTSTSSVRPNMDADAPYNPTASNEWILTAGEGAAASSSITAGEKERSEELGLVAGEVDSAEMEEEEWDRSDDETLSDGEAEEERARLEAESEEAASQRAAMAAAKEMEGSEAEDVRRLLHWGCTETSRAAHAWQPHTTSASVQEGEDSPVDTEGILLFEDVSIALLYYEAEPSLRSELSVQLLQRLGAPCPAAQEDAAGYAPPKLPPCSAALDSRGECGGLFALVEGLEHQLRSNTSSNSQLHNEGDKSVSEGGGAVRGIRREILSVIAYGEACAGGWVSGCRGREALTLNVDGATHPQGNRGKGGAEGLAEDGQKWSGMVRNVFTQMTTAVAMSSDSLTEIEPSFGARLCGGWLEFEFNLESTSGGGGGGGNSSPSDVAAAARAVAKSLLAQERWGSDLGVWRAFGQAEANVGNVKEAQKILDAAMMTPIPAASTSAHSTATREKFAVS